MAIYLFDGREQIQPLVEFTDNVTDLQAGVDSLNAEGFQGGCEPSNFLDPGRIVEESCPTNSGFPCRCSGSTCQDGSFCGYILGMAETEFCQHPCETDEDCPCTNFSGQGSCNISNDTTGLRYCSLSCAWDGDCPPGFTCASTPGGASMCYPG